ncbi:hypothetical protein [Streptomyces laurentii]|uniref:hypothetical protein n=1 Tax=Streptomyces laurentii TaxID=39478 RepID=UPI00369D2E09
MTATSVRFKGACVVVLGLALAAACYLCFTDVNPHRAERLAEYRVAKVCSTDSPRPGWAEDCLRTVPLTVDTVEQTRMGGYRATVSGAAWRGPVSFGDSDPLMTDVRAGDRVDGVLWRGEVMALRQDGVRQATSDEPRDEPEALTAAATAMGVGAVVCLRFGLVWLVRPDRYRPDIAPRAGGRTAVGLLVSCVLLAIVTRALGWPDWVIPVGVVPATLVPVWLVTRRPS